MISKTFLQHPEIIYGNRAQFPIPWLPSLALIQGLYFSPLANLDDIYVSKFALAESLGQSNCCALLIKLLESSPAIIHQ